MTTRIIDAEITVEESVTFTGIAFSGCDFHVADGATITLGKGASVKRSTFYVEYDEDGREVVVVSSSDQIDGCRFELP